MYMYICLYYGCVQCKCYVFVCLVCLGFKIGINCKLPTAPPNSGMAHVSRALCMLSNTTAIGEVYIYICMYVKNK